MSIPAINWCIDQRDLPPGEWVVLFHLCHCHNHETDRCDPSQEYLAKMTNMGERTVRRHLGSLETKGKIRRKKRGVEGGGRLSDYFEIAHEPANMAANVTGQSMQSNRPNGAEKMHEMAGKHGKNRKEQGIPPISPTEILTEIVRPETARDFASHRKQLRKPLTTEAARRLVAKFKNHPDPDTLFDTSIENGWQGVFPEKKYGGQNDTPKPDTQLDAITLAARMRRTPGAHRD